MTSSFRHTDVGEYSAEASDLGFAPGSWPRDGPTAGYQMTLHLRKLHRNGEGEVTHAEYATSSGGSRYLVWND